MVKKIYYRHILDNIKKAFFFIYFNKWLTYLTFIKKFQYFVGLLIRYSDRLKIGINAKLIKAYLIIL